MTIVRWAAFLFLLFVLGVATFAGAGFLIDAAGAFWVAHMPKGNPPGGSLAFREDCFGRRSLRGCGAAPDFDLQVPARSPEFIHNRSEASRYRRAALGVGRLDLRIGWRGKSSLVVPCTGFLVGESYILTAYHCADPGDAPSDLLEAQFVLGFTHGDNGIVLNVDPTPVESCASDKSDTHCDDFLIFELAEGESERAKTLGFGPARLDPREIRMGLDLFILHHPAGRPLTLSTENCTVVAADGGATFFHGCWTFGGSSGAPIFDDETGAVVAMHLRSIDGIAARDRRGVAVSIAALTRQSARLRDISGPVLDDGPARESAQ
jgi:V8-like Glu-specific endopeptidase